MTAMRKLEKVFRSTGIRRTLRIDAKGKIVTYNSRRNEETPGRALAALGP
jgi:hypothetical protein